MTTSSKLALRILVAEDEHVVAEICQRVLASEGFEVDVAANGKTAQHMARNNRYDLALIDIRMPIMSGEELFHWLQALEPAGATDLLRCAEWLLRAIPAPGLVFIISDLLSPDWDGALRRLAAARGDACLLHVLAPEDREPNLQGDLKLLDSETEQPCEVTMGTSVLRRYRDERDGFLSEVKALCHRHGFSYLLCQSAEPPEEVVLRSLRRLGVVR